MVQPGNTPPVTTDPKRVSGHRRWFPMIPARGPQTMFLHHLCYAIFAVQSLNPWPKIARQRLHSKGCIPKIAFRRFQRLHSKDCRTEIAHQRFRRLHIKDCIPKIVYHRLHSKDCIPKIAYQRFQRLHTKDCISNKDCIPKIAHQDSKDCIPKIA